MRQRIQNWILAIAFAMSLGGIFGSVATTQVSYAACSDHFLTFPAWYRGLVDDKCQVKSPGSGKTNISNFVWKIVLNVIEIGLQLVGYIAVGFILYGGYKYIISHGTPDGMVAARKTILNAIIGLSISLFAVAIVNIIARGI